MEDKNILQFPSEINTLQPESPAQDPCYYNYVCQIPRDRDPIGQLTQFTYFDSYLRKHTNMSVCLHKSQKEEEEEKEDELFIQKEEITKEILLAAAKMNGSGEMYSVHQKQSMDDES
jgi:hypothetical protein